MKYHSFHAEDEGRVSILTVSLDGNTSNFRHLIKGLLMPAGLASRDHKSGFAGLTKTLEGSGR